MSSVQPRQNLYGFTSPISNQSNPPIVALRAPTATDYAPIGQLWVNKTTSLAYILVNIASNVAIWSLIEAGGGTGNFANLTVTPGPISLTGVTAVNITGASATNIGTGAYTGTVSIGNTAGASTVAIAAPTVTVDSSAAGSVTVGGSITTGSVTIANGLTTGGLSLGSNAAAGSATVINGGFTGGITLTGGTGSTNATGNIKMVPGKVSAAAYAATLSTQVGQVTLTGQVLASAAVQVLTITNTLCTTSTPLQVTVDNIGTNDAQLTIQRIQPQAGSFLVTVKNNGAAALNGDIHVNFWLLS